MKKLLWGMVLALPFALPLHAQTSYTDVDSPFVNAGDHGWVTFYFGHLPNGEPGTTALVIQCAFHRAELITNYDVYGEQMVSDFFAVTCSQNGPVFVNGKPTTTYKLNAVPLNESLVMYGTNAYGVPVTQDLSLVVNGATWTVSGYTGRGASATITGSAAIAY